MNFSISEDKKTIYSAFGRMPQLCQHQHLRHNHSSNAGQQGSSTAAMPGGGSINAKSGLAATSQKPCARYREQATHMLAVSCSATAA